jgi:hypothetical protein
MKEAMSELNSLNSSKKSGKPFHTVLNQEMKLFEDGGRRRYNLQRAYDFLLTINLTS